MINCFKQGVSNARMRAPATLFHFLIDRYFPIPIRCKSKIYTFPNLVCNYRGDRYEARFYNVMYRCFTA